MKAVKNSRKCATSSGIINSMKFFVFILLCLFYLIIPSQAISGGGSLKSKMQLTTSEHIWLEQHPIIRFGVDPYWAPIEFLDDEGRPQGMSVQYLQYLEEMLNIQFEFKKNLTWSDGLKKLENLQLDMLPAVSVLDSRDSLYNFTPVFLSTPNAIFSAVDRAYLGSADALKGERVMVVENYAVGSWLHTNYPEINLVTAPTIEAALKEVSSGKAFAFVGNLITTSYYIGQTRLTQIRVVGEVAYTNELAMAVRKDWEEFSGILQKALAVIPESKKSAIYNDWISIKYKHSVDYGLLWKVLGVVSLILFSIVYWNRRLAQEITYRRKIEAELILAKQKALLAVEAKSQFLANMSHEIRTPLNAVMGMGHLLLQTRLDDQQEGYIEKMHSSSKNLLSIIDGILDFSKGEAGKLTLKPAPFMLEDVLQTVKQDIEAQALLKGIGLFFHTYNNVPKQLIGDSDKLVQVLRNFGVNAIKFTEEGEVVITIKYMELTEDYIQLQFIIKDSGLGISQEHQRKLFKPFSQADSSITRRYGGTGLGLAICEQLVELMGGKISLDSKLQKGSSFSFVLTFAVVDNQRNIITSPKDNKYLASDKPLLGIKILLVEDDELNQLYAKELLAAFGADVVIAENGKVALGILKEASFDVMLLDIQMPEMDGYETARAIRNEERWNALPIVALTAHALSAEHDKCIAAGMTDYLTKPINPDRLCDMVIKLADRP